MDKVPICPLCSGASFVEFRGRPNARCLTCGSLERTRRLYRTIRRLLPEPNRTVLHIAPESSLARKLIEQHGSGYLGADISLPCLNDALPREAARIELDLCNPGDALEGRQFDLIFHSHVMEHLPCNWALAFMRLHRHLRPGGFHLCCVPVTGQYSAEDFDPTLSEAKRLKIFGQEDHMRRFGARSLLNDLRSLETLLDGSKLTFTREVITNDEDVRIGDTFIFQAPSSSSALP